MVAAVARTRRLRLRTLANDARRRRGGEQNGGRRLRRAHALAGRRPAQRVRLAPLARAPGADAATADARAASTDGRRRHQVAGDGGGRVSDAAGRQRAPVVLHLEVGHRANAATAAAASGTTARALLEAGVGAGALVAGAHDAGRAQHRRHRRRQQRRRALLPHEHRLGRGRRRRHHRRRGRVAGRLGQQAGGLIAAVVEGGRGQEIRYGRRRVTRNAGRFAHCADGAGGGGACASSVTTWSAAKHNKRKFQRLVYASRNPRVFNGIT